MNNIFNNRIYYFIYKKVRMQWVIDYRYFYRIIKIILREYTKKWIESINSFYIFGILRIKLIRSYIIIVCNKINLKY
jgi:hypothetical protein